MERTIPLYTLDGVTDAEKSHHPVTTKDGLGLSLERFERAPCDDVVVLLHGLTNSTDMFIMPEHYNLVSYLLDNGLTDVWCFDSRISNRYPYNLYPNDYSLDDCALYDNPLAFDYIRSVVGENKRIHVIGHCVGSMSFAMSLAAGVVEGISSFVSNSISLTPYIPLWSRFKITVFPFFLERIFQMPYLTPSWSREPRFTLGRLISKAIGLVHRECKEPACHTLSLMWGSGFPAVYRHENLDPLTHARLHDLFGGTGLNYHHHIRRMVSASHQVVKQKSNDERYSELPDNYFQAGLSIRTPILFVTGNRNRVFSDSNIRCFEKMEQHGQTQHRLQVYDNYGHQDVFIGKNAASDTFPAMLDFIRDHAH